MPPSWTEVTIDVSRAHADAVANFLMDCGAPGLQWTDEGETAQLTAYFANDPPLDALRQYCSDLGGSAGDAASARITARLVADMLQLAGADRVLTMDLHAGQIQGFFTIPVDHMTAVPLFARHFRDLGLTGEGIVSVSPDAGRAKQAVRFAEMLDADFALMHKMRPAHDVVAVTEVTGRVRGKTAILGDDVIMTGGTLLANVKALRDHGVEEVWVFATHGLFCGDALQKFEESDIKGMVITDTVPIDPLAKPDKMTVLPVAPLLAETIMNVFADDSVSAIFGGENQLF